MLPPGSVRPCILLAAAVTVLRLGSVTEAGFSCLSNPCVHGVCIDDLNTTYSCYCIDGYTGVQCQTNWDECWSGPCQNGGTCHDGIATYNCSCAPGFVGEVCEQDFNECESNPCLNNGTCIDDTNGYNCVCLSGYVGVHCEIDVAVCNVTNETRCANGGTCVEGPGITFTCKCESGWAGYLCEYEIDECMSAPCQNGAVCIDLLADYSCACLFGFTGKNCEEVILHCDDNPCHNSALCLMEEGASVCYCVPDYHGDRCQYQYDECQLGPRCMNGGTCIDGIDSFSCSCPPQLTGMMCECLIVDNNFLDCSYTSYTTLTATAVALTTTHAGVTGKSDLATSTQTMVFTGVPNITTTSSSVETIMPPLGVSRTTEAETTSSMTGVTTTTTPVITEIGTEITTTTIDGVTTSPTTSKEGAEHVTFIETETSSKFKTTTTEAVVPETGPTQTPTVFENHSLPIATTTETPRTTIFETTLPETHPIETSVMIDTSTVITRTVPTAFDTTKTSVATLETAAYTLEMTSPPQTTRESLPTTSSAETSTGAIVTSSVPPQTTVREPREDNATIPTFFTGSPTATVLSTLEIGTGSFPTSVETTTLVAENITTAARLPDCTIREFWCQNGGTCIYTYEGYQCLCPYDAEGSFCEVSLGIRNAAFAGDSFLTHRLHDIAGMELEFTAKTLSPSGIVFHANIDGIYMTLYLESGYLRFMFSCGLQTMLLSELKNAANDGFGITIDAKLEFTHNNTQCNALVKINDTLSMSGNQIAALNKLAKPISLLHLGGFPQAHSNEKLPTAGFMGCINNLKIFGRKVDIFKDAEDGYKVSECSSLACLSSPCGNGGKCVESAEEWRCDCKDGYLGKTCEESVCGDNPCQFGATCLPFPGGGYICLCPFEKHGHFCEYDLEITEPYFSSSIAGLSSFAAYPIPAGGISNNMELKFQFSPRTMDQISLLLFMGQSGRHDAYSDHLVVTFVKGYVMLTWNLGSGPRRIFTTKPIKEGKRSYSVHLGRNGRRCWLLVDDLTNVTGRSPGNLVQLDVNPTVFIGGHSSPDFSTLPHDLPLHTGFSGCVYDVELRSGSLTIPLQSSKQVVGRALGQCGTTECHERSCQNEGACLHHGGTFTCVCQDGWFGPICSSRFNPCDSSRHGCANGSTCVPLIVDYECDCPTGRSGRYCEKEESLTDVSLTGRRSFISLNHQNFEKSKFHIEFQIRPLRNQGLLLFIGTSDDTFLSLSLHSGLSELRLQSAKKKSSGTELLPIRTNKLLVIGDWYRIRLGKFGNRVYLTVDNVTSSGMINNGGGFSLAGEPIYLGGLPDMSDLPPSATNTLTVPFTGCMRQLSVNGLRVPLNANTMTGSRNVADCDGTPCGGDACDNGGTCWLDSDLKPRCSCAEPFAGDRCEAVKVCRTDQCQNSGKCIDSRCSCVVGWTGAYCESSIRVRTPELGGNGYLILRRKASDKKRAVRMGELRSVRLRFVTAEPDGLLVWTDKKDTFLGLGLENGRLKLTYSSDRSNRTAIEIPTLDFVSDGLWHDLRLAIDHPNIRVKLDDTVTDLKSFENDTKFVYDDLYVGGVPFNDSLVFRTFGLFRRAFSGCIERFGMNGEKAVEDFGEFQGENVGTCTVY